MQKCSSSCSPVSSCGDGTINCGEDCEPPNTATCDANCKSTCTDCANAKSMDKTSISLGETATGTICTISSSNTYDWFKVKANNNGKLIVEMIPSAADLDLEVDKETSIGGGCSNLVWLGKSQNGGANKETVIANAVAGYTYWIKTYYSSGSATGTVTAKLVECAIDSNCPAAKPYCNNNVCVECVIDTDCKGTDGTYNTYCPKDSTIPNYILPSCDSALNECQCEAACTGNAECATDYCCTGGDPQGPNVILPGKTGYSCVANGVPIDRWLCA